MTDLFIIITTEVLDRSVVYRFQVTEERTTMAAPVVDVTTCTAACTIYPNTSALLLAETSRFPIRRLPTPAGKSMNNAPQKHRFTIISGASQSRGSTSKGVDP